eukprot:TRINITY_DN1068_c2_g1_i1.p1 TRINITY_DN1068_c2_g1~~TRINITY_DN1068_c2_g1_i1.p1  ORF type:complete len:381 (+),score=69.24 TRINITY_DN1068_c2_g1_i1:39-1145(+)
MDSNNSNNLPVINYSTSLINYPQFNEYITFDDVKKDKNSDSVSKLMDNIFMVKVKVVLRKNQTSNLLEDDIRRFTLINLSFDHLLLTLLEFYKEYLNRNTYLFLQYLNAEEKYINLLSDDELYEPLQLIKEGKLKMLRINVLITTYKYISNTEILQKHQNEIKQYKKEIKQLKKEIQIEKKNYKRNNKQKYKNFKKNLYDDNDKFFSSREDYSGVKNENGIYKYHKYKNGGKYHRHTNHDQHVHHQRGNYHHDHNQEHYHAQEHPQHSHQNEHPHPHRHHHHYYRGKYHEHPHHHHHHRGKHHHHNHHHHKYKYRLEARFVKEMPDEVNKTNNNIYPPNTEIVKRIVMRNDGKIDWPNDVAVVPVGRY